MNISEVINLQERKANYVCKEPYMDMFHAAYMQGVVNTLHYFTEDESKGDINIFQDVAWFFDEGEHRFSFNWYCSIFNYDPTIERNRVRKAIKEFNQSKE